MRSETFAAVASRAAADGDWAHHLDEFLDDFYRADLDLHKQAAMIAEPPQLLGEPRPDAFLGGAGEHLARRWVCRSLDGCATTRDTSTRPCIGPMPTASVATCSR